MDKKWPKMAEKQLLCSEFSDSSRVSVSTQSIYSAQYGIRRIFYIRFPHLMISSQFQAIAAGKMIETKLLRRPEQALLFR